MFRKWSTLVLVLFLLPFVAMAQNTGKLAGIITDRATNEPLPGATVVIEGTSLGAAADVNGEYIIIGVPVGTYSIRGSFVGYEPTVYDNVDINQGFTKNLNFQLGTDTQLLDELVIEYERPLIQKDAIGAPSIVTSEQIQNLPVRGVANVAGLQAGVVKDENSSTLNVRGGRGSEVIYYVDGVRVTGALGISEQAIQEQSMLIGSISAKYGDAMSGVISITTKGGGQDYFGAIEGITSQVLDPYGYNQGEASFGGPLGGRASFFVSGTYIYTEDSSPSAISLPRLPGNLQQDIVANPQALTARDEAGNVAFVTLPGDIAEGTPWSEVRSRLDIPAGYTISNITPFNRAETLTSDDFIFEDAYENNDNRNASLNGKLTVDVMDNLTLSLGGQYSQYNNNNASFTRSLYIDKPFSQTEGSTLRFNGSLTHRLSASTFYQVTASFTSNENFTFHPDFSSDVRDVLSYGDIEHPANAVARNYKLPSVVPNDAGGLDTVFVNQFADGQFPGNAHSVFVLPGGILSGYNQNATDHFFFSANATTQVGLHQIEFGGEFEQRTQRWYNIVSGTRAGGAHAFARFLDDGEVEGDNSFAVTRWEDLDYRVSGNDLFYYGYNYLGTEQVDDEDLDRLTNAILNTSTNVSDYNLAPYKPIYYGGYLNDKIEYRDLVLNVGIRVDVFDQNTQVLKDPNALVPIVRAGDVGLAGQNGIGSDFAVYYDDSDNVVGYRDLSGVFYDQNGQVILGLDINEAGGRVRPQEGISTDRLSESVFEDYEPEVSFQPRIGVSFPVTDQALFFASYGVLNQRPTERTYDTIQQYAQALEGAKTLNNSAQVPQKTTQYELGFKQRLGARSAFTIKGFFKQIEGLASRRAFAFAFPNSINFTTNSDFGTVKGAEFAFELRRTSNVAIDANYTISFAQGTGSSANTLNRVNWTGEYVPNFIYPLDFDQRHRLNLTFDYRLGTGEGPELFGGHPLANFGINITGQAASGKPYTPVGNPSAIFTSQGSDEPKGEINGQARPWTSLINMKLERRFNIGGNSSLTAYLWVQNLLDADNALGVWAGTGLADVDGYLATPQGIADAGNARVPESFVAHYANRVRTPGNYGIPRLTRLGFRFNF